MLKLDQVLTDNNLKKQYKLNPAYNTQIIKSYIFFFKKYCSFLFNIKLKY